MHLLSVAMESMQYHLCSILPECLAWIQSWINNQTNPNYGISANKGHGLLKKSQYSEKRNDYIKATKEK